MASFADKKKILRQQIIEAAQTYSDSLAGKVFLYVYGDSFFEVVFQNDRFMHLTGVSSRLAARDFYKKSKRAELTAEQIFFDQEHSYAGAKKKLQCLKRLPSLTDSLVCVVKTMTTLTLTYKIGVTNLDFTLGLVENTGADGKAGKWLSPRTLRVRDKAIENSADGEFIDFIFVKDASRDKYEEATYADSEKSVPESVREMLSDELFNSLCKK